MNILFLCTAHNSLSQLLFIALSTEHDVTIEYALSEEAMITATELTKPDLILCPFLTVKVPQEIYERYMTLIIHPGPPGDSGPSSLDWMLMGDDGSIPDADTLLSAFDQGYCPRGRSFWGVTVLQANEVFDCGPIWAFDQFPINIDQPELTKSALYRNQVTQAALRASTTAIERVKDAARSQRQVQGQNSTESQQEFHIDAQLTVNPSYGLLCTGAYKPFLGGNTGSRPLLRPANRGFDVNKHTAQFISRRVRCGDSQPGALSNVFGPKVYIYGGIIEENVISQKVVPGVIFAVRHEAVCIGTCDGKGVWITHIRRLKKKTDTALWPKVSAVSGLIDLGVLTQDSVKQLDWELPDPWHLATKSTFQEVWIELIKCGNNRVAYVYFNFYNGAMSTAQCQRLLGCLNHIISISTVEAPISALVLMGGSYFSNGIALNVIEASPNPSLEGWNNINAIDDIVFSILHTFGSRNITTVGAVRGNAAAGGVALAAACDFVIAGENIVMNPSYRGIGLYGSEYHTLSYYGRCGQNGAKDILMNMTPISAECAKNIGLVDYVVDGIGQELDRKVMALVERLLVETEEPVHLPNQTSSKEPNFVPKIETSEVDVTTVPQNVSQEVDQAQWLFSSKENDNDREYSPFGSGSGTSHALGLVKPLENLTTIKTTQIGSSLDTPQAKIEESGLTSISKTPILKSWKTRLAQHVVLNMQTLSQARTGELAEMALDFWSPRSARFHQRRFDFTRKVPAKQTPLRFARHRRGISSRAKANTDKEKIYHDSLDEEEQPEWDDVMHWESLARSRMRNNVVNKLNLFLNQLSQKEESNRGNGLGGAPENNIKNATLQVATKMEGEDVNNINATSQMEKNIVQARVESLERTQKQEMMKVEHAEECGVLFPCYYNPASIGTAEH
jgi:enoyl-CoA hydratase/carnithine racemase/methionyl-tRNA formyltransferase